ncbi:MAG: hypothetical protein V2J02_15225, partial [Pseudomonadales bacterium]|nr:hypothetical protein [Pseudomonadales bacterium]
MECSRTAEVRRAGAEDGTLHLRRARTTRAGLLSLLLLAATHAGATEAPDLQRDLDVLREQLLAIHPDPFARTAPEAFEAAFTDLRSQLPALDADEALIGMMRLVALHRDGHTSVSAAPLLRDGCFFPVRVRAFDGDLHVTTLPAPQRALVGARVLAVGDVPAAD